MFGKAKGYNSNVWKKQKYTENYIPVFGKAKIWNSNVWKKPKCRIPMFGKAKI